MEGAKSEIAAIVLAAGQGKRIGGAKALHPLGDSTFIESILANLRHAGILDIIIVASPDIYDSVQSISGEAKVVINPRSDADMWSSLRVGLREASDVLGCMIIPVDHPFVQSATYGQLMDAFILNLNHVIVPHYQNYGGHPVLLPFSWASALPDLPVEGGLRSAIKQSRLRICRISVDDPGVLRNINEKADLSE